ncbi:carbon-nitrogen hydrolase family protein [Cognatishimia sp. F0-27]|uniref:carbon-nitrogen hydrolase family protein n=1 Tax=Cognatishimia sp. F0-27 TaxID=2816855 RepID=UPI001D0C7FF5|nr:carbon-nitrogen hydrolase family protein [Cognatishimia sp. F0-27]MCC1495011.1 carbon-nitrogen hydrolase family protein [Cognatishimia sp. F0-27]
MILAAAAYPPSFLPDWDSYAQKITDWVAQAATKGADLCVFPEYGALEVATLDGEATARDLEGSIHAVSERIDQIDALHADLASRYRLHILAASAPVFDPEVGARPVNRARLFTPTGAMGVQDKQIMTQFERDDWHIVPGGPLRLFDTALGKIGVLICYDCEFPLLGRALAEADLILVPSVTEALHGHSRVRIGARARALENQCVTVMASLVGPAAWSEAIDISTGRGGMFGPPDIGFPDNGVLAQGAIDHPGWTLVEIDRSTIAQVRAAGVVRNRAHWSEQKGRDTPAPMVALR